MVGDIKIKEIILRVTEKIKEGYKPERIILYGSFAYGKPDKDSDIDLFIIKKTDKRRIDRFCEVRRMVRDIRGISIQPVIFTPEELDGRIKLRDDFVLDILKRGKRLYG